MPPPDRDPRVAKRFHPGGQDSASGLVADFTKVLVVGKSQINRVVVSKIVERSGLKPISETPEMAAKTLQSLIPGAVVLDGGADNKDCDSMLSSIAALRQASDSSVPSVILLSNKTGTPNSLDLSSVIDVVVAKPITTERLQPIIDRLVGLQHS